MKHLLPLALAALTLALPAAASAHELPGEKPAEIAAIPGVIAADATWEIAWSGPMAADGMATDTDGNVLFAQEQSNAIWKLWPDGNSFAAVPFVLGAGAVSVDPQGRMIAVERGCTDPGLNEMECNKRSAVVLLGRDRPGQRTVISDSFANGSSLGRLNDVYGDGEGGAWVTQGALYHVAADGTVSTVYEPEAFTNGVVASPDYSRLYVTDRMTIYAFDLNTGVRGATSGVFATLDEDTQGFGGDGMAVDGEGRLYVTGDAGVYVFAPDGAKLGVIPVPRRAITLTFAGPDRSTLYVGALGAVTPSGEAWETAEGVRNIAMTVYRVEMLSAGN